MQAPTGEFRGGVRFSTGAHWASATAQEDQDFDVGAGYVYEHIDAPNDIRQQHDGRNPPDGARTSQGAYLSFAKVLSSSLRDRHRTWLGIRAEYLHASQLDGGPSINILARANWEIFGPVIGAGGSSDDCGTAIGAAYGTVGLGLYVEGGARRSLDGEASFVSTAGVSVRLPALWGMAFGWCD